MRAAHDTTATATAISTAGPRPPATPDKAAAKRFFAEGVRLETE